MQNEVCSNSELDKLARFENKDTIGSVGPTQFILLSCQKDFISFETKASDPIKAKEEIEAELSCQLYLGALTNDTRKVLSLLMQGARPEYKIGNETILAKAKKWKNPVIIKLLEDKITQKK